MAKKVLITGSNGLLGQKLVNQLKRHPSFKLIATSRGKNRIKDTSGYIYESLNITKKDEVEHCLGKYQPDIIINTAAMTNVDACELNQEECWQQNVVAVQNFVDVLNTQDLALNTHFIHLSTDFVFDGENGPYKEEDEPNPLSFYGKSKHEAEKIIQNSGLKLWSIVRTIIVYGIVDDMSRSNVVLWAKGALEKGDAIKVVDDQFRAPTLAEDLAAGCILVAEKQATGIYHISGKDIMSILDLVKTVAEFYNLDQSKIQSIKSETLNQAAKRPPRTGFTLNKAYRLGYKPHSFLEGIKILDDQLKQKAY